MTRRPRRSMILEQRTPQIQGLQHMERTQLPKHTRTLQSIAKPLFLRLQVLLPLLEHPGVTEVIGTTEIIVVDMVDAVRIFHWISFGILAFSDTMDMHFKAFFFSLLLRIPVQKSLDSPTHYGTSPFESPGVSESQRCTRQIEDRKFISPGWIRTLPCS